MLQLPAPTPDPAFAVIVGQLLGQPVPELAYPARVVHHSPFWGITSDLSEEADDE